MITQANEMPPADDEHSDMPADRSGLVQASRGRIREARRVCRTPLVEPQLDADAIRAEARRAHVDGDVEGGRHRIADHHRHLASAENAGLGLWAAGVIGGLQSHVADLSKAEAAEEKARKKAGEFRRVRAHDGTSWTALSMISIALFAVITLFLFYSSMKVVTAFLYDLGRIESAADGFVIAPLTVLAPFVVYIVSLCIPERGARKRYTIGVAVLAMLCCVVWVMTFPFANPNGGGVSDDPWGVGGSSTPGPLSAWYVSTVAQLFFDVLLAAACKIAIHQICESHSGERYRRNPLWVVHTRRLDTLVRTRRAAEDALARVKAKRQEVEARTAAFAKQAIDAFDDRLKKLRTDTLDAADIRDPVVRIGRAVARTNSTDFEYANPKGRI